MISYVTCLSLSGLLHSLWWSLGPPTFLQMALLCYFLWMSSIPLCVCVCIFIHSSVDGYLGIHIFIHSSVDGYLGCFHILAIINSAAMNIGVNVSFWIIVFIFSGYMLRIGIAGSYVNSVFSFLRNYSCTNLHPHHNVGRSFFMHTFSSIYCL